MGRKGSRTSGRKVRLREAELKALKLRRYGLSYTDIAAELGVSRSTAFRWVSKGLEVLEEELRTEARRALALELSRLDSVIRTLYPRVVAGELAATDRFMKALELRAKLLGLGKERVELSGPDGGPIEVAAQAEVVVYVPDNGREDPGEAAEGDTP